jgi:hypothetical protein
LKLKQEVPPRFTTAEGVHSLSYLRTSHYRDTAMAVLESPPIFTAISLYSLSGVLGILITAYLASSALLPKNSGWRDRSTFVWLAFDALIHFIFEG